MRRLALFLLLVCASPLAAKATDVTVTGLVVTNSQAAGTTATVRAYYDRTFTDSLGNTVIGGPAGGTSFYTQASCTVVAPRVSCQPITLASTTDSSAPAAKVTLYLYDSNNRNQLALLYTWAVPPSPATTTPQQLTLYTSGKPAPLGDAYITRDGVLQYFTGALFANPATTNSRGVAKSSMSVADPVFVETTDPRNSDQRAPLDGSVTDTKIAGGGLSPSKVAGTAVVTADPRLSDQRTPLDNSVTAAKLGSSSVTYPKLAPDALGTATLPSGWQLTASTNAPNFISSDMSGVGKCVITDAGGTNHRAAEARLLYVGGNLYAYVRSLFNVDVCQSSDNGQTWVWKGTALTVGSSGSWDDNGLTSQTPVYKTGDATIGLYYAAQKTGVTGNNGMGWATCSVSQPWVCTKQGQIFTKAQVATALGVVAPDLAYVVGLNAYWTALDGSNLLSIYLVSTTDLSNPTTSPKFWESIYTVNSPGSLTYLKNVFGAGNGLENHLTSIYKFPSGPYTALVVHGSIYSTDAGDNRSIVSVTSPDGKNWPLPQRLDYVLSPSGWGTGSLGQQVTGLDVLRDPADDLSPLSLGGRYLFAATGYDQGAPPILSYIYFGTPANIRQSKLLVSGAALDNVTAPLEITGQTVGKSTISGNSDSTGSDLAICQNAKFTVPTTVGGNTTTLPRLDRLKPSLCMVMFNSALNGGTYPEIDFLSLKTDDTAVNPLTLYQYGVNLGTKSLPLWSNLYTPLQFGARGSLTTQNASATNNTVLLNLNAYFDGTNWRYRDNGVAALISLAPNGALTSGIQAFLVADSGTKDAVITWTTSFQVVKNGVVHAPVTVANLPASPTEGTCAWVTDSNTSTYNATVAGGGTNHVMACYDGSNWKVH
jgi:hypothetical protein